MPNNNDPTKHSMKKVTVISTIAAVTLCALVALLGAFLVGLMPLEGTEKMVDTGTRSSTAVSSSASASASHNGTEESPASEIAYLERMQEAGMDEIHEGIGVLIGCASMGGDSSTVADKYKEIMDRCDAVIYMEDVPPKYDLFHDYAVDAVESYRSCARYLYKAIGTNEGTVEGAIERSALIELATDALNDSTDYLDRASAEMDRVRKNKGGA